MLPGCGEAPPPTGTVSGVVEFVKPPTSSLDLLVISPSTGKGASTQIAEDGAFEFEEPLLVGEYTAYLAPQSDPTIQEAVAVTLDKAVPEKYWNEVQSPLKISVSEGENTVSLKVE
ncbi:MAG: hypothetical protein RIK87_29010 [Fuerstiella sp.]